jgi:ABC-type Fe3+ transport system permease subunit
MSIGRRHRHRGSAEWVLLLPGLGFLLLFFVYPLSVIVYRSIAAPDGFTLARFLRTFPVPAYRDAWINTVWFASLSTVIAAVGGTYVGYWTSRLPLRMKGFLLSLYAIPVTLSGLVVAFGFIVLFGRNGVVNQLLLSVGLPRLVELYTWSGLLFVFPFYNIPLFALVMTPLFETLGRDLVDAARVSGARGWAVWRYVLLPNLLPGLLAGASVVQALMMGAFGTALAITGFAKNLLSLQVYSLAAESTFDLPQANALAVLLMVSIGTALWVLTRWERRYRA